MEDTDKNIQLIIGNNIFYPTLVAAECRINDKFDPVSILGGFNDVF